MLALFIGMLFWGIFIPENKAEATVPVFDEELFELTEELYDLTEEIYDLIDERTFDLNSMIAGIYKKEVAEPPIEPAESARTAEQQLEALLENHTDIEGNPDPIDASSCESFYSLDCLSNLLTNAVQRDAQLGLTRWLEGKNPETGEDEERGPLSVKNFNDEIANELDNERQLFIEATTREDSEIVQNLCEPLKKQVPAFVKKSLSKESFSQKVSCSLDDEAGFSYEGFNENFANGGFEAWEKSLEENNNMIGTILTYHDEAEARDMAKFVETENELLTTGGGLKPKEDCGEPVVTEDGRELKGGCVIKNPGELTRAAANYLYTNDLERLREAKGPGETSVYKASDAIGYELTAGGQDIPTIEKNRPSLFDISAILKILSQVFQSDNKDKGKPPPSIRVTVKSPLDLSTVTGSTQIKGTVSRIIAGGAKAVIKLDGSTLGEVNFTSNSYTFTWDTTKANKGDHTLTVQIFNSSGKLLSQSAPITVTVNNQ
nr:MAG: hypothetical protein UV11_C0014G0006 [Candidatus Giovannonibacteria bacterium GW2011_GWF2_42_19]